jgi:sugar phosphate isomerase/epimerase
VLTHSASLTADPAAALELCRLVPGLGLTLDPSHYIQGPHRGADYEPLLPYVQNVHFRDTGKEPGAFQVRVGQGEVEYNKIITLLERRGYSRSLTIAIIDRPDNPFDREVEVRKLRLLLESFL